MSNLLRDLRYGIRMLYKTPGLSVVAILTIALGVGLTTHTFSIVYGSVIRGLPYDGADRLMFLTEDKLVDGNTHMRVPIHDFMDWRDQQTTFEELAALYPGTVNLADADQRPERFLGAFVTTNTFSQAGVKPILGRGFSEGEDLAHAAPTMVLGYEVWQNRYGGDPDILGRTIRANGSMYTVIGVMPKRFKFPFDSDVWLPLAMNPAELERGDGIRLAVFGRLKVGVSMDQAGVEFATIAQRLAEEYPATNDGVTVGIGRYTEEYMPPQITAVLWAMLVAVFGVLLIACANVANLLLARAASRSREMAVRSALGASRATVIRQLLVESFVLAVVGGVVGVGLSYVGIEVFNAAIIDIQKPFWIEIDLFPPVLIFAIAVTLVASIVSGMIPAFRASGTQVHEVLKDASRGSSGLRMSRFTTALVIGEIAVSCALLVAAGFMVKSIVNVQNVEMGFTTEQILTARVGLNENDYPDDESRLRFHEELVLGLGALPGARSVSLTSNLPASGAGMSWYGVDGEAYATDQDYPFANRSVITPGFFSTFGVSVLEGQDFSDHDRAGSVPVAIVNESFVRRHFADGSAVGRRIRFGRSDSEQAWLTIVGVVPDLRVGGGVGGIGSDDRIQEHAYIPLAQNARAFMSIAIATGADPMAQAPGVRGVVVGIDANLPIYNVETMEGVIEDFTWAFGLFGSLFALFGGIALFMAAVGLYGVMAFSVSQRTQEMGIRMAMGAHPRAILSLVLKKGFTQLVIGMTVGLGLGAALSSPLRAMLFEVSTADPTVYLAIVLTLSSAGFLACIVPARRATRVDLVEALRPE